MRAGGGLQTSGRRSLSLSRSVMTNLFIHPTLLPSRGGVFTCQKSLTERRSRRSGIAVKPRYLRPIVSVLSTVLPAPISNRIAALVNPAVLKTSLTAIFKLLATVALGVAAASRGVLDGSTMTALSKVVYNLFLPSLLFSNIMTTLSRPLAPGFFFLPLAAIAQVAIGLFIGSVGASLLRLNRAEKNAYIVCAAFGNSAALPLLFASSLFAFTPSLPHLVSSISFFLVGWTCLFWSIAYTLLATMRDADSSTKPKMNFRLLSERILKPPLISSFLALLVGLVAPLRSFIMATPFFPAITTLGTGYGPAAVLILAGSLARAGKSKPIDDSRIEFRMPRMIAGIAFTRFVCIPTVAFIMVKYGPFRSPFVALAILLEAVMPPAQNSTLILTLEKRPDDATAMASILFAVYLIGVIPISIALTFFLAYTGAGLS